MILFLIFSMMSLKDAQAADAPAAPFDRAIQTYCKLRNRGLETPVKNKGIMAYADFSSDSEVPSFWVLDLNKRQVLFQGWATHGEGTSVHIELNWSEAGISGSVPVLEIDNPNTTAFFSNIPDSHQSSVGMAQIDPVTYVSSVGGNATRLNGLDGDLNDLIFPRDIVIHGDDMTQAELEHGTVAESWGCFMFPRDQIDKVLNLVIGQPLFINHQRMDPDVNEREYQRWKNYELELQAKVERQVTVRSLSELWPETKKQQILKLLESALAKDFSTKVEETHDYFKNASLFLTPDTAEDIRCIQSFHP